MPFFDFECQLCGHVWEQLVKMDEIPDSCPKNISDVQMYSEDVCVVKHNLNDNNQYDIKKLPSKFGTHLSWSQWRAVK